jgi:chromate transporter
LSVDLSALFLQFLMLSMLAVGGAITLAPDMHRYLVDEQKWLTDEQFSSSIALAQASPGPNVIFVGLLGFQTAGLAGCLATLTGIMVPSAIFAIFAARFGRAHEKSRAVLAFKAGMAPITIALLLSTGWLLAPAHTRLEHASGVVLFAATALLVWRTKLHLLWLIGGGALVGALGLV